MATANDADFITFAHALSQDWLVGHALWGEIGEESRVCEKNKINVIKLNPIK